MSVNGVVTYNGSSHGTILNIWWLDPIGSRIIFWHTKTTLSSATIPKKCLDVKSTIDRLLCGPSDLMFPHNVWWKSWGSSFSWRIIPKIPRFRKHLICLQFNKAGKPYMFVSYENGSDSNSLCPPSLPADTDSLAVLRPTCNETSPASCPDKCVRKEDKASDKKARLFPTHSNDGWPRPGRVNSCHSLIFDYVRRPMSVFADLSRF